MLILHKRLVSEWKWLAYVKFLTICFTLLFSFSLFGQCSLFNGSTSTDALGSQAFAGRLGMRFTVNSAIEVTRLGVFDSGQDAISGNITVGIVDAGGNVVVGPMIFFGILGAYDGHFMMNSLSSPVTLSPGTYTVVAFGFSSSDPNGNSNLGDAVATVNTGGGLITHVDSPWDNTASLGVPSNSEPIGRFHAGNFAFRAVQPTLTATVNGASITTINNGVNDSTSLSVCSGKPSPNINLGVFSTTGGSLTKVHQEITFTGTTQSGAWCTGGPTCVGPASAFNGSTNTFNGSGTVHLRFRPFVDANNNNTIDSGECTGDWAVFTVNVNPQPNAGPDQTACLAGRAIMAGSGTGTWTAEAGNPGSATIVSPSSPTTDITGFSQAGVYNFIFSHTLGCSDTASVTVSNTVITCWSDTTVNIGTPGSCDTIVNLVPPTVTACPGYTLVGPYIDGVLMTGATTATFSAGAVHTVAYAIYDPTGFQLDSCGRRYTINDFTNPSLACQQIQSSLGFDCKDTLTVREVLVGWDQPGALPDLLGCDSLYKINVIGSNGQKIGPIVSSSEINKTLMYTIVHPNGFSCWSTVKVEDKIKPTINCGSPQRVHCLADISKVAPPTVNDNCPGAKAILVDTKHIHLPCDENFIGKIARTWVAEDAQGLRSDSTCTDSIFLLRSTFTGITPAPNDTLRCNDHYKDDGRGTGYPHPDVTGVPQLGDKKLWPSSLLDMQYCNAVIDYEDRLALDTDCKTRIQRFWTITEWHCDSSRVIVIGMQLIDIIDDIKPSIPRLDDITITTESRSCKGRLVLPQLNITDQCTDVHRIFINAATADGGLPTGHLESNGGTLLLDLGLHSVSYKALDECGNDSTMTFKVLVRDDTDPVALCDELATISLKANGYTEITADAVNDGSYDECGPVTIKIRRMEDPCKFGADDDWFDKVGFCCLDGDSTRMVQLKVRDVSGNENFCMVSVRIQNKVTPTITCPLPQTKPCDFTFDPSNLKDYFGPAIITGSECAGESTLEDIIIEDKRNQCGIGYIIRRISLPNNGGSCTQRIDFTSVAPFNASNITWPRDTTLIGQCSPLGLDTAVLGAPRFTESICSMVGLRYDDQIFPFTSNGACFKVIRTWKVIDWCQPSTATPPIATWTFEQEIKVMDVESPILNLPISLTYETADCSSADVEIVASATDCTPNEDLKWNYTVKKGATVVLSGTTNIVSDEFELGEYKVIWRVEDRCGNFKVDSMNFRVVTIKAPSPICKKGLASPVTFMDTNGDLIADTYMTRLTPTFFDNKSFHACDPNMILKFSFSPNVNDTVRIYTCDSLGTRTVRMYVTDKYGNQNYCETFVDIQGTKIECPNNIVQNVAVSGRAANENNESIEGVNVELKGSELPLFTTDRSGKYNFGTMPVGGNYQIIPSKDGDDINGVTTLDAVIIQRHILGIEKLKSPYQIIAADANGNGSVTASDLTELRKLLIGVNTSFQNNTSWKFVDASYVFSNANNPWQTTWPEWYNIDLLKGNVDANFVGIKVGDVNGNAKVSSLNQSLEPRTTFALMIDDKVVRAGDKLIVPLKVSHAALVYGAQTKLISDGLHISAVTNSTQWSYVDAVNEEPNLLRINMANANGFKFGSEDPIILLQVEAIQNGQLSQMLKLDPTFSSEIYNDALESKKLAIQWRDNEFSDFTLIGTVPNPWNSQTSVSFSIPASGKVSMRIMDYTGRNILTSSDEYPVGEHTITINKSDIGNAGVYLYELRYNDKVLGGKMIVID